MNEVEFTCPYCGQPNSLAVDTTGGARQAFTTDCEICCRPVAITVFLDDDGEPMIDARAELLD